jgi:hypothetical protein
MIASEAAFSGRFVLRGGKARGTDGPRRNDWSKSREWILDCNAGNRLSRVQVFGENPRGAALDGCGNNQCVPEADSSFVLNTKGPLDLIRGCFDTPVSEVLDNRPRVLFWQRLRKFSRDSRIELLQHLHTHDPRSLLHEAKQYF